jgi:hypothetical protein
VLVADLATHDGLAAVERRAAAGDVTGAIERERAGRHAIFGGGLLGDRGALPGAG